MLPDVDISFQNGQLSQTVDAPDGVFALVASAVAVASTFLLNTPYKVRGMVDVAALGIIPNTDNHVLHKTLREFYAEAGDGTELWIIGMAKSTKVSAWFTPAAGTGKAPVEAALDTANGDISMLLTAYSPTSTAITLESGLDADVWLALAAAQALAETYTAKKKSPFYTLFEGYGYDGNAAAVKDLKTLDYNRCQIMLGDTETRTGATASKGAAVGLLAGRKAKSRVQVNPGRKKDGRVNTTKAYILDTEAQLYDVATLHDKGYVTFRQHPRSAGYYFTDDPMACAADDDYNYATNRRVIDKAYKLAYDEVVEFILDNSTVTNAGTLDPIYAKTIEGNVISAIYSAMTLNGELSYDPNNQKDFGVICEVDLTHNVTSTSRIKLNKLQVRNEATNRFIDIPLGFVPITTNN